MPDSVCSGVFPANLTPLETALALSRCSSEGALAARRCKADRDITGWPYEDDAASFASVSKGLQRADELLRFPGQKSTPTKGRIDTSGCPPYPSRELWAVNDKLNGVEERLLSLESSAYESKVLLKSIPNLLNDGFEKQCNATQTLMPLLTSMAGTIDSILSSQSCQVSRAEVEAIRMCSDARTELSCVKVWLDEHERRLAAKLSSHDHLLKNLADTCQGMSRCGNLISGIEARVSNQVGEIGANLVAEVQSNLLAPMEQEIRSAKLKEATDRHGVREDLQEIQRCLSTLAGKVENAQSTGYKGLRDEVRALNTLSEKTADIACIKGWLEDHTREICDKFQDHASTKASSSQTKNDSLQDMHTSILEHISTEKHSLSDQVNRIADRTDPSHIRVMLDEQSQKINAKLASMTQVQNDAAKTLELALHYCEATQVIVPNLQSQCSRILSTVEGPSRVADSREMVSTLHRMEESQRTAETSDISDIKTLLDEHNHKLNAKLSSMSQWQSHVAATLETASSHSAAAHRLLPTLQNQCSKMLTAIESLPQSRDNRDVIHIVQKIEDSHSRDKQDILEAIASRDLIPALHRMEQANAEQKLEVLQAVSHLESVTRKSLLERSDSICQQGDHFSREASALRQRLDTMTEHTDVTGLRSLLDDHMHKLNLKLGSICQKETDLADVMEAASSHSSAAHRALPNIQGQCSTILAAIEALPQSHDNRDVLQSVQRIEESHLRDKQDMLEALRHVENALIRSNRESVEALKKLCDPESVHGWLHLQTQDIGVRIEEQSRSMDAQLQRSLDQIRSLAGAVGSLPSPPDEQVILNSIHNSQDSVLRKNNEGIEILKKQCAWQDNLSECLQVSLQKQKESIMGAVNDIIADQLHSHTESMHAKLAEHARSCDDLCAVFMSLTERLMKIPVDHMSCAVGRAVDKLQRNGDLVDAMGAVREIGASSHALDEYIDERVHSSYITPARAARRAQWPDDWLSPPKESDHEASTDEFTQRHVTKR